MSSLTILESPPAGRLPRWLKRPLPVAPEYGFTESILGELGLETVCQEARCPNRSECWSHRTATFMILGRICTRPCGFCSVARGRPDEPAEDEPERVARAAERLGLTHVVITSVNRDDLPDGGADHFRRCITAVRARVAATIEVLTPDFAGDVAAVDTVLEAGPDVFNHNLETVARLQRPVRRRGNYADSLRVLRHAKRAQPGLVTKSGLMLGLGETLPELVDTFADLRSVGCDLLTIGQYLRPAPGLLPVERYVPPEEFDAIGSLARRMSFRHVASGPFVRSSYHAGEAWLAAAGSRQPDRDPS